MFAAEAPNAFKLRWASDFDEGLVCLRTKKFDACLLDYHLGSHNGVELLDEIVDIRQRIPIIVLPPLTNPSSTT